MQPKQRHFGSSKVEERPRQLQQLVFKRTGVDDLLGLSNEFGAFDKKLVGIPAAMPM
ncbi:hypothetical protein [Caballeronia sp. INDeC2]|uniref:hypothetical protein n=1 Tax=Caballeronia sp. INDeC2 TaxID=2921747 RepID=UPI002027729E|nr:hypothetical protein [Caballeronia sp. INDeC2]